MVIQYSMSFFKFNTVSRNAAGSLGFIHAHRISLSEFCSCLLNLFTRDLPADTGSRPPYYVVVLRFVAILTSSARKSVFYFSNFTTSSSKPRLYGRILSSQFISSIYTPSSCRIISSRHFKNG